jgi:hypothetical protein
MYVIPKQNTSLKKSKRITNQTMSTVSLTKICPGTFGLSAIDATL